MGGQSSTTRENANKQIAKKVEISISIIQKCLDALTKATELDKDQYYEEALPLYMQGVIYILHIDKYGTISQSTKEFIKEKCEKYLERIKLIKAFLGPDHSYGKIIEHLETPSDNTVFDLVTEISNLYMSPKKPEK